MPSKGRRQLIRRRLSRHPAGPRQTARPDAPGVLPARRPERCSKTYWTTLRGRRDHGLLLRALSMGARNRGRTRPPGWPQQCSYLRTDGGPPGLGHRCPCGQVDGRLPSGRACKLGALDDPRHRQMTAVRTTPAAALTATPGREVTSVSPSMPETCELIERRQHNDESTGSEPRQEWLAASALSCSRREKQLTRMGDELARRRPGASLGAGRESRTRCRPKDGPKTLAELFDGRFAAGGLPLHVRSRLRGGGCPSCLVDRRQLQTRSWPT